MVWERPRIPQNDVSNVALERVSLELSGRDVLRTLSAIKLQRMKTHPRFLRITTSTTDGAFFLHFLKSNGIGMLFYTSVTLGCAS